MSVSAKRNAQIEITSSAAHIDRGLNEARRKMRAFQRDTERDAKAKAKADAKAAKALRGGVRGIASGVGSGILTGLGLDAAGGLKGMATDVLDYEKALTRLQITADQSPATMAEFSASVMMASNATGLARTEILGAAAAYVALTGDMATAQASTETWSRIAQATGTPMADIASTAAALHQQLGIAAGDMEAAFSGLAAQGKAGAVELKDLAGLMAQIAPQWALFQNGKGARGVAELGSALQVVKRGFGGDASETVTGLQSLLTAVTKNAGRFEAGGVKIFNVGKDGTKSMRDVFSIVDAIGKSKLVKDPEAMEKAFGRVEAYRAYLQLTNNRAELERLTKAAADGGVIQRDFATYMDSASGKMEAAWTRVKNAVSDAMSSERVKGFADALEQVVTKVLPLLTAALDRVGSALGALYGVGQSVRGAISGAPNPYGSPVEDIGDKATISSGGDYSSTAGWQVDADARTKAAHVANARRRMENRAGYASARDEIMAGEIGDKTSPESISRAFRAKYGSNVGGAQAGGAYLTAAKVADPNEVARQTMSNISDVVAQAKLAATIKHAIEAGFSGVGIRIGGEPVHKASANSIEHRRGRSGS